MVAPTGAFGFGRAVLLDYQCAQPTSHEFVSGDTPPGSLYILHVGGFFMFRRGILFAMGGSIYVSLELLWRRRSHWTMFVLGGGCFLLLGRLNPRLSPLVRMGLGSALCTAGELLVGLVFNRDFRIWDYRMVPLNFRGQICLPFSLLWAPLSLIGGGLCRKMSNFLRAKHSD